MRLPLQATNLAAILGNALAASLGGGAAPAYSGGGEEQLAHSLLAQLAAAQVGWRGGAGLHSYLYEK